MKNVKSIFLIIAIVLIISINLNFANASFVCDETTRGKIYVEGNNTCECKLIYEEYGFSCKDKFRRYDDYEKISETIVEKGDYDIFQNYIDKNVSIEDIIFDNKVVYKMENNIFNSTKDIAFSPKTGYLFRIVEFIENSDSGNLSAKIYLLKYKEENNDDIDPYTTSRRASGGGSSSSSSSSTSVKEIDKPNPRVVDMPIRYNSEKEKACQEKVSEKEKKIKDIIINSEIYNLYNKEYIPAMLNLYKPLYSYSKDCLKIAGGEIPTYNNDIVPSYWDIDSISASFNGFSQSISSGIATEILKSTDSKCNDYISEIKIKVEDVKAVINKFEEFKTNNKEFYNNWRILEEEKRELSGSCITSSPSSSTITQNCAVPEDLIRERISLTKEVSDIKQKYSSTDQIPKDELDIFLPLINRLQTIENKISTIEKSCKSSKEYSAEVNNYCSEKDSIQKQIYELKEQLINIDDTDKEQIYLIKRKISDLVNKLEYTVCYNSKTSIRAASSGGGGGSRNTATSVSATSSRSTTTSSNTVATSTEPVLQVSQPTELMSDYTNSNEISQCSLKLIERDNVSQETAEYTCKIIILEKGNLINKQVKGYQERVKAQEEEILKLREIINNFKSELKNAVPAEKEKVIEENKDEIINHSIAVISKIISSTEELKLKVESSQLQEDNKQKTINHISEEQSKLEIISEKLNNLLTVTEIKENLSSAREIEKNLNYIDKIFYIEKNLTNLKIYIENKFTNDSTKKTELISKIDTLLVDISLYKDTIFANEFKTDKLKEIRDKYNETKAEALSLSKKATTVTTESNVATVD
ncbi:MAG: hypothetical protein V1824_04570 [archaeon]